MIFIDIDADEKTQSEIANIVSQILELSKYNYNVSIEGM